MTMKKTEEYTTLYTRSRILGDVIKELNKGELCITKLVISADKNIETKLEHHPIPELEKYQEGKLLGRKSQKRRRIRQLPLMIEEGITERINEGILTSSDGIDLEYINKVLTNPPYDFPYVRIEEIGATILKEVPKGTPKKITFKRTKVKQASVVSTLKPQPHAGPKYTLELTTTRQKDPVTRLRELIATTDPIKICRPHMMEELRHLCDEILQPKED